MWVEGFIVIKFRLRVSFDCFSSRIPGRIKTKGINLIRIFFFLFVDENVFPIYSVFLFCDVCVIDASAIEFTDFCCLRKRKGKISGKFQS